jgi:hypothetical protein
MATIPTPKVSYSGLSYTVRESGGANNNLDNGSSMPKAPATKRSWLTCIRYAAPELKMLVGLVLVITALAMAWMLQRGVQSPTVEGLRVPILLSLFAIVAFAPPLVLNFRSTDAQWRFMAAMLGIGWRSTISTIALLYLMLSRTGQDFLLSSGLVACYFPLLVLQSWLLTRQAKRL